MLSIPGLMFSINNYQEEPRMEKEEETRARLLMEALEADREKGEAENPETDQGEGEQETEPPTASTNNEKEEDFELWQKKTLQIESWQKKTLQTMTEQAATIQQLSEQIAILSAAKTQDQEALAQARGEVIALQAESSVLLTKLQEKEGDINQVANANDASPEGQAPEAEAGEVQQAAEATEKAIVETGKRTKLWI